MAGIGDRGHHAQAFPVGIGRSVALTELVQQAAVFLIGLGRWPNRDNGLEITPGLCPKAHF